MVDFGQAARSWWLSLTPSVRNMQAQQAIARGQSVQRTIMHGTDAYSRTQVEPDIRALYTEHLAQQSAQGMPAASDSGAAPPRRSPIEEALRAPLPGGDSAALPEPDWAGMWGSYSRWVGSAQERYGAELDRLSQMPGLTNEQRADELARLQGAYQSELDAYRGGPTYGQLQSRWEAQGSPGGTMEDYYTGAYGAYTPSVSTQDIQGRIDAAQQESAFTTFSATGQQGTVAGADPSTRRGPAPGALAGDYADIAGLGRVRSWWAA